MNLRDLSSEDSLLVFAIKWVFWRDVADKILSFISHFMIRLDVNKLDDINAIRKIANFI